MDKASTSANTTESAELFKSVLGGLSEQQWKEYKLQRKLESGLLPNDDDENDSESGEDEEFNDTLETFATPFNFDEELVTKFDILEQDDVVMLEQSEEEEEEEEDVENIIQYNPEMAVKYINGEIEFSTLMDNLQNSVFSSKDKNLESDDEEIIKKKKPRRFNYELPSYLKNLMGDANLCFVNGNIDAAVKKCIEVINMVPTAQDPYHMLSCLYEEIGESEKSLECAMVAAHLNPSVTEEWIRLANIMIGRNQIPSAIKCLSFAIRNEPKNINLLWQRYSLYEKIGDTKNALASCKLILKNYTNPNDGPKCIEIARNIAKLHHSYEDSANAFQVLEIAFSKFPLLVTAEDVNMLLEHLMSQKMYKTAVKNLILHCGVVLETDHGEISSENVAEWENDIQKKVIRCKYPEFLHIDLMTKLVVCLIHLNSVDAIHEMLELLKKDSPEEVGDLYYDVAEALLDIGEAALAKPLWLILVNSHKYNEAGVWLKYAECLNKLNEKEAAVDAYERVLRMAPAYQEARIPWAELLDISGNKTAAVDALKQEWETGPSDSIVDMNVLMRRMDMLYELKCYEEFIPAAKLSLLSHCFNVKTEEEFLCVVNNLSLKRRREALKELPSIANRATPTFVNLETSVEKLWDVFFKLCRILFDRKHFEELQNVVFISMTSDMWRKSDKMTKDIECLGLISCFFCQNHRMGYNLIKHSVIKNIKSNRLFNLLSLNVLKSNTIRHNRFCLRLMAKNPEHIALGLFNGHNAMICGTYKLALGEYVNILKKMSDNPEANFYVGITYIHLASQKFATKRPFLMFQGLAFLQKYVLLKNENQEALYNMGRGLHQLGIKDTALQYYKRALEAPPSVTEGGETFDLRREIACNIALIYESYDERLASMYLRTYNVL